VALVNGASSRDAASERNHDRQEAKEAMAIQDVKVISVPVSDQERAKAFYVDKLGFTLSRDDDSIPGLRWIQVAPEGGGTSLTLVNWFETMPAGSLQGLVIGSSDLRGDCAELEANGVEFEQPVQEQDWGAEAVIRDPDGNMIVLQQA
jgi:catechol 2,3-dioxygenase-like lactoylglutathione lyase family enzyme